MSHRAVRPGRVIRAALVAAALALVPASTAHGAARYEEIPLPSTQGNIDLAQVKLNGVTSLAATVRLPDGYDENPGKAWPVLYMFDGIGGNSRGWKGTLDPGVGNFPGIIVTPESGRGFLVDWYKTRGTQGVNWMSYFFDEVVPAINARYRIKPGRQNHALGGISMGAYGALVYGGQLPGYFGSIISLSALVDPQTLDSYGLLPGSIGAAYEDVWGPLTGPYATSLNPLRNVSNFAGSRLYLSVGNGIADPTVLPWDVNQWTVGGAIEGFAFSQNLRFDGLLALGGVQHVSRYRIGVHAWPYWKRELPNAIAWNPFAAPPVATAPGSWKYSTMQPRGNAWGIGYRFAAPPADIVALQRTGQKLTGTIAGSGATTTTVTINPGAAEADASGAGTRPDCSFTTTLPFTRTLPAGC